MDRYACFKERLIKELREEGLEAEAFPQGSGNGIPGDGIILKPEEGRRASPVAYTGPYFALFKDGALSFEEILEKVRETLKSPVPRFLSQPLLTGEQIRERIVPTVTGTDPAAEGEDARKDRFLDLSIVYRMFIENDEIGQGMVFLPPELLAERGVLPEGESGREELFRLALENMRRLLPAKTAAFSGAFTVLSNEHAFYGASQILDTRALSCCADEFGESFFILPSSRHELILLPDSAVEDPSKLVRMVREVNRTAVEQADYLSDSVYRFDRDREEVLLYASGALSRE